MHQDTKVRTERYAAYRRRSTQQDSNRPELSVGAERLPAGQEPEWRFGPAPKWVSKGPPCIFRISGTVRDRLARSSYSFEWLGGHRWSLGSTPVLFHGMLPRLLEVISTGTGNLQTRDARYTVGQAATLAFPFRVPLQPCRPARI